MKNEKIRKKRYTPPLIHVLSTLGTARLDCVFGSAVAPMCKCGGGAICIDICCAGKAAFNST
jgi:hypothetical protein